MNIDINNIDPKLLEEDERITAYLKGQMSSEEQQLFLKELESNPELKEKAVVTARLVKGLKEVGSEQDKDIIGAFLASSEQGVANVALASSEQGVVNVAGQAIRAKESVPVIKTKKGISFRKASTWISIAAAVVLMVWLVIDYSSYRNTTALAEQFGADMESGLIIRGSDTPSQAEKKLKALFANVKANQNIEETIHELSLCWELSTMETYNDYTDYSAEIGWNLAIAYLKDNNKKGAKRTLEKLIEISEDDSAINVKAKELLKKF